MPLYPSHGLLTLVDEDRRNHWRELLLSLHASREFLIRRYQMISEVRIVQNG